MSSAVRLPISCGFILVALTTEEAETRDWVCEIMRDLIGVSIATTSTWAIITIMFRSAGDCDCYKDNKTQYFRLRLYDSDFSALDCSLTAR